MSLAEDKTNQAANSLWTVTPRRLLAARLEAFRPAIGPTLRGARAKAGQRTLSKVMAMPRHPLQDKLGLHSWLWLDPRDAPPEHPALTAALLQAAHHQLVSDHAAEKLRKFAEGGSVLNQVGMHDKGLRLSKLYRQRG
jgi:hypothetical protein